MFWLLNKKGFSELLKGILVVVLIIFSLFAFKGPIIDGFNSVFKLVISEKGELKTDDSALEVLRGAYEHCKGEAGSECLCSGGVNLVLSKNELVTVWDSGGGVLIESNQEGSSTVDSVTFCVAEHKRIKDTCSFVYDADAIFNSEEISFSFLNSEWVYTSDTGVSINNKVYLFFNNILEQGSGLYQPTGIFDEENYVRVVDEASDLKLLTFKGVTSLVQNDLIFSGKLYYVSVITDSTTGFPRGECLDTFPYHCVTVNEVKFMFTLVDVPNFYFNYINLNYGNPYQKYDPNSDEFGVDIGEGYIYYDGTDFYGFNFATTDRQTMAEFIRVVGIKDAKKDTDGLLSSLYSHSLDECKNTYTDKAILSVCEDLEGKDYLGGLNVLAESANLLDDTVTVDGYSGKRELGEHFDAFDLEDACNGFYTMGRFSFSSKGEYQSNALSFGLIPFVTPVTFYRVVEKDKVGGDKLYLCIISKSGFDSVSACKAEVANLPITDPSGALYNPYYGLDLEWGYPLEGVVMESLGKFNHPNFNGYNSEYYPQRYKSIHRGVDLMGNAGDPVLAVADGVVRDVRSCTYVVHTDGQRSYTSSYCHVDGYGLLKDRQVKKGEVIGVLSSSTSPHVHLEIYSVELDDENIPGAGESSILANCGCTSDKDCDAKTLEKGEPIKGCAILEQDYFLIPPEELIAGL